MPSFAESQNTSTRQRWKADNQNTSFAESQRGRLSAKLAFAESRTDLLSAKPSFAKGQPGRLSTKIFF